MKYALALLAAVLFFFFGRLTVRDTAPKVEPVVTAEHGSCEELAQFRGDFEEYQKLKGEAERYKKADEILGKMMVIFLADLGLHASRVETPAVTPASSPVEKKSEVIPAKESPPEPASPSVSAETAAKVAMAKWRRLERNVMDLRDEEELRDDLKKLEIKDLFSALKNQVPLSNQQMETVSGHYAGQINFNNNAPPWAIEWDLNLRKIKNEWQGTLLLTMSKNGKVFSRTTGEGKDKNFHSLSDGQGIIVEVYGGDGYLQVYPLRNFDKLTGIYYEKKGLDSFVPTGTVSLQRVL